MRQTFFFFFIVGDQRRGLEAGGNMAVRASFPDEGRDGPAAVARRELWLLSSSIFNAMRKARHANEGH